MASPMQGQIKVGEVRPCNIVDDPYGEYPQADWPDDPKFLVVNVDGCPYLVEYYVSNSQMNGGFAFQVVGMYKLPTNNCANSNTPSNQTLWREAMIKVIDNHPEKISDDEPTELGYVYHFYNASCSYKIIYPTDPIGNDPFIPKYLKYSLIFKTSTQPEDIPGLSDYMNELAPYTFTDINEIRDLGAESGYLDLDDEDLGEIDDDSWGIQIVGGWRSCLGSACCYAKYYVKIDNSNEQVYKMTRADGVVIPSVYDCSALFSPVPCEPNCDVLFEEWSKYSSNTYTMQISPNPAQNYIGIYISLIPQGNFLIQIIDNNTGNIVYSTMAIIDGISYTNIPIPNLPNGAYTVNVLKDDIIISSGNLIIQN